MTDSIVRWCPLCNRRTPIVQAPHYPEMGGSEPHDAVEWKFIVHTCQACGFVHKITEREA